MNTLQSVRSYINFDAKKRMAWCRLLRDCMMIMKVGQCRMPGVAVTIV